MLNCLAAAIPGGDRVVSAEEVFELRFPHPDWVPLQTRQAGLEGTGEIRLRELVKEALRTQMSSFRTMMVRPLGEEVGRGGIGGGGNHEVSISAPADCESVRFAL